LSKFLKQLIKGRNKPKFCRIGEQLACKLQRIVELEFLRGVVGFLGLFLKPFL